MRRRSTHGSHSRWLLEQVRWEIRHTPKRLSFRRVVETIRNSWDRRPFVWSGGVQAVAFLVAWMASEVTLFPDVPPLDLENPSAVIGTAWQVLAGFAAIAFAGLAVLMQLTSEPVVTSRGVRQVLFQVSQFRPVLAFSITGAIQVGAATLFLDQPESAIVEVTVVALTVLWIGRSYARVGRVYANPGEARRLGEEALLRDLKASMRKAHARSAAEDRLHAIVPREWRWTGTAAVDGTTLVAVDRAGTLVDVDIDLLRDITNDIADEDASALTASEATNTPDEPSTGSPPELRIMTSIGSTAEAGQEIYILKNPESYTGNLDKLRRRLTTTLRWEESS